MKSPINSLSILGYACGVGAGNPDCEKGPLYLQNRPRVQKINLNWVDMLAPLEMECGLKALKSVAEISQRLAKTAYHLTKKQKFFVTLGGDHSCAIGTWSGVASAILPKKLGLLWIDAHLDSHTMETTLSGNLHGMPLAVLLGEGHTSLTHILSEQPKILPENVALLGVRSYEPAEKKFLERLNVRIYYIEEVNQRGFGVVFEEAINYVMSNTDYFGISLDLDAIDPVEAPGVGTPEPQGIALAALQNALTSVMRNPHFIAAEIAEFNPALDQEQKTETIIVELLEQFQKYAEDK